MIAGRVLKFGDNIDTDVIIPGRYLTLTDLDELGKHAMEGIDPTFPEKAEKGVILVVGKNFGCGSSREQAPLALKCAGVKAIVAESFARIFYRNAINVGLPILECPGIASEVEEGHVLEIYVKQGLIVDKTTGRKFAAKPLPDFILSIIEAGGLIEYLRRRGGKW